jgi:hypothetical protein
VRPGEKVSGWKRVKLLPFSLSMNLYARRGIEALRLPPPSCDSLPDFSAITMAEIHDAPDFQAALARLRDGTRVIARAWRRLLGLHDSPCSVFVPGLTREHDLRIGWRRPLCVDGILYRHTNRTATFVLKRVPGDRMLEIEALAPPPALHAPVCPCAGEIRINGNVAGDFRLEQPQWKRVEFPLPEDGSRIVEVELFHDSMPVSMVEGESADLGIGVRWARVI